MLQIISTHHILFSRCHGIRDFDERSLHIFMIISVHGHVVSSNFDNMWHGKDVAVFSSRGLSMKVNCENGAAGTACAKSASTCVKVFTNRGAGNLAAFRSKLSMRSKKYANCGVALKIAQSRTCLSRAKAVPRQSQLPSKLGQRQNVHTHAR